MTKLRVPFTRSLSLTRNFTLTSDVVVVASSLSRTAHCFSRTPKLCTECSFFCFFSPSCLYQSTHWHKHFFPVVVLFNCLCFTRFYFTAMPLAVEKTRLSNHLLQNLQTGLDHRSITSASTVAVVDVLEFCRHRHTLEGCRNCCCCCCRNLPVFFFLETHGITTPRGTHDFPSFLRGSHTVLVPWGHARDRSNSNSSSLWSLLVGRGFSPKNTDTAYRQIIKYNNKQQVYMITT